MNNSALIIVDMLYDFIDGSLACHNAENAVNATLKFIDAHTKEQGGEDHEILDTFPILFIRDCHPADHSSFVEFGGTWPAHCVRGTRGGELHDLKKDVTGQWNNTQATKGATMPDSLWERFSDFSTARMCMCAE